MNCPQLNRWGVFMPKWQAVAEFFNRGQTTDSGMKELLTS
jgi:hypothetical protein